MSQYVDRFQAAVQALIGDGPVKQRLMRAYADYLEDLKDVEPPINLNGALSDLHAALHSVKPVGKQTCVDASVQKMSPGEAGWHAETIFKLYAELVTHTQRPEPLKVVDSEADDRGGNETLLPRFLVSGT